MQNTPRKSSAPAAARTSEDSGAAGAKSTAARLTTADLGPCDQFAGLSHLLDTDRLAARAGVLLAGVGPGFGCARGRGGRR